MSIRGDLVAVPNEGNLPNGFRSFDLTIWLLRGTWPALFVTSQEILINNTPLVSYLYLDRTLFVSI